MLGDGHDSYCLLYNCMFILCLDEHALEEKLGDHQFYYSLAWQARNVAQKKDSANCQSHGDTYISLDNCCFTNLHKSIHLDDFAFSSGRVICNATQAKRYLIPVFT